MVYYEVWHSTGYSVARGVLQYEVWYDALVGIVRGVV